MRPFNNIKKIAVVCFIAIAVYSCNQEQKPVDINSVPSIILGSNDGVFRGVNLGDSIVTVWRKETLKPIETDSGYLYYEYLLLDTIGSYNITYNFDEQGLYEIQSYIFINDAANTEMVLNGLKKHFDKYYASTQADMGFNAWSVKSDKVGAVKINLSDESNDFTIENAPGKLSLWIYKDDSGS